MNDMGTLPAKLASSSTLYKLPPFPQVTQTNANAGQTGHVLRMVREELKRIGYSDSEIDGGGLRVTTTFTRKAMQAAAQGVAEQKPDLKDLHVAVASVDPQTGALRGMYAGQDYLKSQINWAVAGGAPGSTFKPFSLATGLDYGYSLKSIFDGSSPQTIAGTEFSNEGDGGGESFGDISLLTATEKSVNTAYVNLVDSMPDGVQRVIDTAVSMGIPRNAPGLDPSLSIVLGSATISPIDMANAYGTIDDDGLAKKVFTVQSVRSDPGRQELQAQGADHPGDLRGRRRGHVVRPPAGHEVRHRHQREHDRPARRRQDRHRHHRRRARAVVVVRRLHARSSSPP